MTPQETEERFVYSLGDHAWDVPSLQELLEKIIPQNSHFNDFEVDHEFPVIGRRTMLLNFFGEKLWEIGPLKILKHRKPPFWNYSVKDMFAVAKQWLL